MKTVYTFVLLLASASAVAQYYPQPPRAPVCHQEMVCYPGQPCRFVMVCN